MKNEKKSKNDNSRIAEISKRMGEIDIQKTVNIKTKKEKSKLDISKKKLQSIKIFKNIESKAKFLKRVDEKIEKIKEDLENQLIDQGKYGGHFDHEIENYLFIVKLQEAYKRDIQINGIRYYETNGNGIEVNKPNESCQNLLKFEQQGLSILNTLDLKAPDIGGDDGNDDLYS